MIAKLIFCRLSNMLLVKFEAGAQIFFSLLNESEIYMLKAGLHEIQLTLIKSL